MSGNAPITAEDQLLINKFARFFQEQIQLSRDVKDAENEIANINEAGDEILLLDDDDVGAIPFKIGQTFVHFDSDSLTERLDKKKETLSAILGEKKGKLSALTTEMEQLKKILYGKFGNRINLESERDE